mmetsp:Transcript_13379/g.28893  ORF Transcript_13379/g.28893 Transcript_13379/m.28893 type:complete len:216 (-) Transcript_13379:1339-1986(-)
MKTRSFFPASGPKMRPVRLETLSSIVLWKSRLLVREEKLMLRIADSSAGKVSSVFCIVTDLAVPLSPTKSTAWFMERNCLTSQAYLVVSTVGTKILLKSSPGGGSNSAIISSHGCQRPTSRSKAASKSDCFGSDLLASFLTLSSNSGRPFSSRTAPSDQVRHRMKMFSTRSIDVFASSKSESKSLVNCTTESVPMSERGRKFESGLPMVSPSRPS